MQTGGSTEGGPTMRINLNERTAKMALPLLGAQEDSTGLTYTHLGLLLYWNASDKRYYLSVYGCERKQHGDSVVETSSPFSGKSGRKVLEQAPRYSAKTLAMWASALQRMVGERDGYWHWMEEVAASYGATISLEEG